MVLGWRSFCRNFTSLIMSCHFCTQITDMFLSSTTALTQNRVRDQKEKQDDWRIKKQLSPMTLRSLADWQILVCYLICLLATVGHLLNGHHLIVTHISGLMEDNNTDVRKTNDTKHMDLHKKCWLQQLAGVTEHQRQSVLDLKIWNCVSSHRCTPKKSSF